MPPSIPPLPPDINVSTSAFLSWIAPDGISPVSEELLKSYNVPFGQHASHVAAAILQSLQFRQLRQAAPPLGVTTFHLSLRVEILCVVPPIKLPDSPLPPGP